MLTHSRSETQMFKVIIKFEKQLVCQTRSRAFDAKLNMAEIITELMLFQHTTEEKLIALFFIFIYAFILAYSLEGNADTYS